jgi:hypothetical protein
MRTILAMGAVLALAAPALAQQDSSPQRERKADLERALVAARVPLETITTGAPYSAQTVTEMTQTLGDGNRISRRVTGRVYRDGAGRVRREEDRPDGTIAVSIVDPVAGASYRLDPESRIAWKTPTDAMVNVMRAATILQKQRAELEKRAVELQRSAAEPPPPPPPPPGMGPGRGGAMVAARGRGGMETMSAPPLEHRTIDGIAVEGHSMTRTIPAGEIGNEKPITVANEEWPSAELKVLVMTRHSDPRSGESIYRLSNIVRAEPDATLFTVPPGYEIRDTGVRREEK